MEPAQIDWKRIDSRFVEDVFYEHIRAPKWFDFSAPNHLDSIDDDAWFCKPECNHPKRPEDFISTPTSSKHPSLTPGSKEENQSFRGLSNSNNQQSENQATPPSYQPKSWRVAVKSTSVKKVNKEIPKLKSTQSANLFSGRDILGHISDLCSELKRLASRVTEREDTVSHQVNEPYSANELEIKKETKPLLQVSKDKLHDATAFKENRRRNKRVDDAENIPVEMNILKKRGEERKRNKRFDDQENIPIPTPLKLESVKKKGLLQIRTNPPSPQCFSDNTRPLRSKTTEKGMVEQVAKRKEEEAEARVGLDVLWFLKPCTTMAN